MTIRNGLTNSDDERVALKTLTLAQKELSTPDWPDLAEMERDMYQEDSFVIQLPIGDGFVAPLQVGLHHGSHKTIKLEAMLLADCVREYRKTARTIISGLKRVGRVAEALAADARARGAPIEFESVGIETQTSAWGFPMGRTEVVLGYPGEQMRPQARTFIIGKLKRFRDEVIELSRTSAMHARGAAVLERLGALAFLDPIAAAAIADFGLDPIAVLAKLLDNPHSGNDMNNTGFIPGWYRSTVHGRFTIGSAQWSIDRLVVRTQVPETVIVAAPGRRLCELAAHPFLEQAVVAEAASHNGWVEFRIEPLAPLLLMADGAVIEMGPTDREAVLAIFADAPVRPMSG